MGFTKLDEGILRSSIMAEDAETFKVWIAFLASCGPDGIARVSAVFLSSVCHLPLEIVHKATARLEAPDPESRSGAEEGRRIIRIDGGWFIVNFEKYRSFNYSLKNEAVRKREYRYRVKKGIGTSRDKRDKKDNVPFVPGHSASASASASDLINSDIPIEEKIPMIIELWNKFAEGHDLAPILGIAEGSTREKAILARLKDPAWDFEKILRAIHAQPFTQGDNETGWAVDFDFILKPSRYIKLLEGAYRNRIFGRAKDRQPDDPNVGRGKK